MSEHDGIIGKIGKREKLENPARVAELDPAGTLKRVGFRAGQTLCDIGAGSGLFSLAAAKLGAGTVWAADTDADILAELRSRAASLPNLHTLPVNGCAYPVADGSADWALLVTTLHEIDDKPALFSELRRLLAADGAVCLIEFIKARTPMGPPPERRLGAEEAEALFVREGFRREANFVLGDDFYCQVYRPRG
jgi:ubiquinone/menaquinone biosynthesis C-methylase UbiE